MVLTLAETGTTLTQALPQPAPPAGFDGRNFQIAPTAKKHVTVLFHPNSKLWLPEHPPSSIWPTILGHFSL